MKISFYILSFICTSILIGCTKDYEYYKSDPSDRHSASIRISDRAYINKTDIIGTWINTINSDDTIIIFEGKMARWNKISKSFFHFYNYTINEDSIIIDYTGLYKVGTPQYRREIYLNNSLDLLSIRNFHTVYPGYIGDKFRKLHQ